MAQTVVLRKRWHPRRGVFASSIGVPQGMGDSYPKGTLFVVEQLADGRLVYTPVLQPPAAAAAPALARTNFSGGYDSEAPGGATGQSSRVAS
jgi:hypothetical protein